MRERSEEDTRVEQASVYVRSPNSGFGPWFALVGDVLIGCTLFAITLPLFALVALAIKLDSLGPVYCRNPRLGRRGSSFLLLKFRTTTHDAQPIWGRTTRETRVGQLLRYTRMDELPQIINVARGEMRLIGTAGNRRVIATRSTVEIVARPELDGQ
jgi:lipopolysaccharide/colanic/teichoic acid biosynthesis glycosyltransferase